MTDSRLVEKSSPAFAFIERKVGVCTVFVRFFIRMQLQVSKGIPDLVADDVPFEVTDDNKRHVRRPIKRAERVVEYYFACATILKQALPGAVSFTGTSGSSVDCASSAGPGFVPKCSSNISARRSATWLLMRPD